MRRGSDRIHPCIPLIGLVMAGCLAPWPAHAQQARTDSLEARVLRLEALVDSLLRVVSAGDTAPTAVEAQPPAAQDELAALRAAARAAAERARPVTTDTGATAQSRTSSLTLLNPEISVTGDFVGGLSAPDGGANDAAALPREFELAFQSALDPYTRTKIFFSKEEELPIAGLEEAIELDTGLDDPAVDEADPGGGSPIELEEGYLTWVGLPGNLGLKAGKFRQELGLYNRWHTHALFEIERPLPIAAFLGDDGLIQTGVSLTLPSFQTGPSTQTITLEATKADNKLFDGGTDLSYLGRVQSFFDLSPDTYLQVGVNGVSGQDDEAGSDTRLAGVDVAFRWAPLSRSRFRELTLKGEWYWADRDTGAGSLSGNGGYGQAHYRWDQRWVTGFRADFLDGFGDGPTAFQLVPSISWWQSEWVRLRIQYNFLKRAGFDPDHTFLFQTVWAIGPHKHETY